LCSQMLAPPHCLHPLLWRLCSQMLDPPHSLHMLLSRLCGHFARTFFTAPPPAPVPPTPSPRCAYPAVPAPSDKGRVLFSTASPFPRGGLP
jgi:hypothetical protein